MITRTLKIDDISPEELAAEFCYMDDRQQARFFAHVREIAAGWPGAGWRQQSCSIIQRLDDDGRFVVETLAGHLPATKLSELAMIASECEQ